MIIDNILSLQRYIYILIFKIILITFTYYIK